MQTLRVPQFHGFIQCGFTEKINAVLMKLLETFSEWIDRTVTRR
jgi:hypothetical protein